MSEEAPEDLIPDVASSASLFLQFPSSSSSSSLHLKFDLSQDAVLQKLLEANKHTISYSSEFLPLALRKNARRTTIYQLMLDSKLEVKSDGHKITYSKLTTMKKKRKPCIAEVPHYPIPEASTRSVYVASFENAVNSFQPMKIRKYFLDFADVSNIVFQIDMCALSPVPGMMIYREIRGVELIVSYLSSYQQAIPDSISIYWQRGIKKLDNGYREIECDCAMVGTRFYEINVLEDLSHQEEQQNLEEAIVGLTSLSKAQTPLPLPSLSIPPLASSSSSYLNYPGSTTGQKKIMSMTLSPPITPSHFKPIEQNEKKENVENASFQSREEEGNAMKLQSDDRSLQSIANMSQEERSPKGNPNTRKRQSQYDHEDDDTEDDGEEEQEENTRFSNTRKMPKYHYSDESSNNIDERHENRFTIYPNQAINIPDLLIQSSLMTTLSQLKETPCAPLASSSSSSPSPSSENQNNEIMTSLGPQETVSPSSNVKEVISSLLENTPVKSGSSSNQTDLFLTSLTNKTSDNRNNKQIRSLDKMNILIANDKVEFQVGNRLPRPGEIHTGGITTFYLNDKKKIFKIKYVMAPNLPTKQHSLKSTN